MEDRTQPQPSVEDLGALIRNNRHMSCQLENSMLTWSYLREVMGGEAPPPVITIRVPVPGQEESMLVERDLAGMDLESLRQILMPFIIAEGLAVVDGCHDQSDMTGRMVHICDALMRAHAPDEGPVPGASQEPPPREMPRRGVAARATQPVQCVAGQLSGHGEG